MVPAEVLFTLSYYSCPLQLTLSKERSDFGRKQNLPTLFQDISRIKFIELFISITSSMTEPATLLSLSNPNWVTRSQK